MEPQIMKITKTTKIMKIMKAASRTASLVALAGCEYQASFSLVSNSTAGPVTGSREDTRPAPSCFEERFQQPAEQITRKLDILFVTDTSGSLSEERVAIASGIDSFISTIPSDADFRLALLPAHGPLSSHYGRMYRRGNEPRVLSSASQTLASIRSDFIFKNGATLNDSSTDGGEAGLVALKAATTVKLAENRSAGFFREDAALAVVFVSDENDICATYPAGVTRVPDPEGKEASAYQAYCKNSQGAVTVNAALIYEHLRGFMGSRPLLLGSMTYLPGQPYPQVGENEPGYGLFDLVDLGISGLGVGVKVNLAAGNYAAGLAEVGQLSTRVMNLLTTFTLGQSGVDPATLTAQVDGQTTQVSFDPARNAVVLSNPGTALSQIDVSYCLRSE